MAVMAPGKPGASATVLRSAVPATRSRMAVVMRATGVALSMNCSQSGMVAGSTMMIEAKTSANVAVSPSVMTVDGLRISRPLLVSELTVSCS